MFNLKVCRLCGTQIPEEIVKKLGTPISKLGLSTRAYNCLYERGIEMVEQLLELDHRQLMRIRKMGPTTANEINEKVKTLGFAGW